MGPVRNGECSSTYHCEPVPMLFGGFVKIEINSRLHLEFLFEKLRQRNEKFLSTDMMAYLISEDYLAQKEVFQVLKLSATSNKPNLYATELLGYCYLWGIGVKQKPDKAFYFFNIAVSGNILSAHLGLGLIHEKGLSVTPDAKMAAEHYQVAALQCVPLAQFQFGRLLAKGEGIQRNLERSFEYFRNAALNGIPSAQQNTAYLLQMGIGVKKDITEALKFYYLAAKQKWPRSLYNLGVLYLNNDEIEQNIPLALKFYKEAAKAGEPHAQYDLAVFYKNGLYGLSKNLIKAETYFVLAKAQDVSFSKNKLRAPEVKKTTEFQEVALQEEIKLKNEPLKIVSMAPINSSGDIYHILSYIIYCLAHNLTVPPILLTYDTITEHSGSKTDTRDQVERSLTFAQALGYENFFKNPFLEKILLHFLKEKSILSVIAEYTGSLEFYALNLGKGTSSQPNPRQAKLESYFQSCAEMLNLSFDYIDQKALTTLLSYSFLKNKRETSVILQEGYRRRNLVQLSQVVQKALKSYANYWMKEIDKSRELNQPLVILHVRHAATANKKQDAPDNFITKLAAYITSKGFKVWFIFADSRIKGSFSGINTNRISPFSNPLRKEKLHYKSLMQFDSILQNNIPGYDFGKLQHLELLLSLFQIKNLKGIVGNTSGTLDLAGFMGHNVYNMHLFTQPKLSYQDYRILMQMTFFTVEHLKDSDSLKASLENFEIWLKSQENIIAPSVQYEEPKYTHAGFKQLIFSNHYEKGCTPMLMELPQAKKVKKFICQQFKNS